MTYYAVFEDGSRVQLLSTNLCDAMAEAKALGADGVAARGVLTSQSRID